jgi:hypothetical protein
MRRIKQTKQSSFTRTTTQPVFTRAQPAVSVTYKPRAKTIVVPVCEVWAIEESTLLRYDACVKACFGTILTNKGAK